ncbi:MAG: FAD-binding oxidoreductase [Oscillospiraceae bacterium]|jgi:sarcosine oxidase subunit beta|nr:FAD-binding oxidoreductase [Oscillospiraceae bacterium]
MSGAAADVIVIGAGAIGSAAAYNLTKKGLSVIVLEKSDSIGNGGSSRNGGGVRQSGRDPRELPMAMYSVRNLWPSLSEELGMDVEYCQKGNLRLGKTEEHLNILRGLTKNANACGLDVRMIDAAEAREICPYLSDEVAGASWCPTDGHANPMLVTLAFYRAARRGGARFITGREVTAIRKVRGRVREAVTSSGEIYEADSIVLAAGYDSGAVLGSLGFYVPMAPVLMEVLVTEEMPSMFYQMLGTAKADFYGHQSMHGSFVFGGSSGYEAYNRNDGTPVSNSMTAPSVCRAILGYFPALSGAKIVRTWAGWIDECADHVPVMGLTDEAPGLVFGCAFSGHGFGISPAAGMLLAELAAGEPTTLDVSAFRYDRFKAKI